MVYCCLDSDCSALNQPPGPGLMCATCHSPLIWIPDDMLSNKPSPQAQGCYSPSNGMSSYEPSPQSQGSIAFHQPSYGNVASVGTASTYPTSAAGTSPASDPNQNEHPFSPSVYSSPRPLQPPSVKDLDRTYNLRRYSSTSVCPRPFHGDFSADPLDVDNFRMPPNSSPSVGEARNHVVSFHFQNRIICRLVGTAWVVEQSRVRNL